MRARIVHRIFCIFIFYFFFISHKISRVLFIGIRTLGYEHGYVLRVFHKSPDFREYNDLTSTMRCFAIPRSATQVKRNTMQSRYTPYSDVVNNARKGLLFLCPLWLACALTQFTHRTKNALLLRRR